MAKYLFYLMLIAATLICSSCEKEEEIYDVDFFRSDFRRRPASYLLNISNVVFPQRDGRKKSIIGPKCCPELLPDQQDRAFRH